MAGAASVVVAAAAVPAVAMNLRRSIPMILPWAGARQPLMFPHCDSSLFGPASPSIRSYKVAGLIFNGDLVAMMKNPGGGTSGGQKETIFAEFPTAASCAAGSS